MVYTGRSAQCGGSALRLTIQVPKGSKSLKLFNSQLLMKVAKENWGQL